MSVVSRPLVGSEHRRSESHRWCGYTRPFGARGHKAKSEGLEDIILFEEAGAEDLPIPNASFYVCVSFTVAQAVDADRMLGEMVRVTRSGGRIGVLARGDDLPYFINLLLRAEIIAKAEAPLGRPSNPAGCADASLYRRFHQVGLTKVKMFPYLTAETDLPRLRSLKVEALSRLTPEEAEEWRITVTERQADGTLFIAVPFHCALGTKPA